MSVSRNLNISIAVRSPGRGFWGGKVFCTNVTECGGVGRRCFESAFSSFLSQIGYFRNRRRRTESSPSYSYYISIIRNTP
jgi:hypothetical protein